MSIITTADQITPAYLTQALTASGALSVGYVANAEVATQAADWSSQAQITVEYSTDAEGALPRALRLKMCQGTFGRSEVDYLSRDYANLPEAPIPRCYDAQFDSALGAYHVLMDDLAATHENNWQRTPTLAYAETLAEALARLHAHYWHAEQRAGIGVAEPTAADIERYSDHIQPGLAPLLEHAADLLQPGWSEIIEHIFARYPARMVERLRDARGITLVHGDLNPGNILVPKNGATPTYLLDRQPFDWSLTTWLAASDLAYAMVTWWTPERRRQFEQPMVRHYHAALIERGVRDYSWEQLWHDYRLCAVETFYVAVEWCVLPEDRERMRWVWQPELVRAMAAYTDLGCAELLG